MEEKVKISIINADLNNVFYKTKLNSFTGKNAKYISGYDAILSIENNIISYIKQNESFISKRLKFFPLSKRVLNILLTNKLPYFVVLESGMPLLIEEVEDIVSIFGETNPYPSNFNMYSLELTTTLTLLGIKSTLASKKGGKYRAFDFYTDYKDLKTIEFNSIVKVEGTPVKSTKSSYVNVSELYVYPEKYKKGKYKIIGLESMFSVPKEIEYCYIEDGVIYIVINNEKELDNYTQGYERIELFFTEIAELFSDTAYEVLIKEKENDTV